MVVGGVKEGPLDAKDTMVNEAGKVPALMKLTV